MADTDTFLVQLHLSNPQLLYNLETQEVYSCHQQGQPVLLTCTRFQSTDQLRTAVKRVEQVRTVQLPRVLGYFGHAVEGECLAVVEEYGEKPVFSVIEERKAAKAPYSDAFLIEELKELVDVLAIMQELGMSHGAISPLSLYFTSSGFKISLCRPNPSPASEETYFSPAKRLSAYTTFHNPYKSDVYSLGAVFLALSLLRPPDLEPLNRLHEAISTELNRLSSYPRLQRKLKTMMSINDISRPDFTGLRAELSAEIAPSMQEVPIPPGCLQCDAAFPPSGPPFPLWCTLIHGFCSKKCAENYILQATQNFTLDLITVKCRICGTLLESDNLADCVGGQDILVSIKKAALSRYPLCVVCRIPDKETYQIACGCYYCRDNLSEAFTLYSRSPLCDNCSQPFDKDELRHYSIFGTHYAGTRK